MLKLRLFFIGFLITIAVFGQDHLLVLKTTNRNRNVYYKPGDELTFYRKGQREKIRDEILSIGDSVLSFSGYQVRLEEIAALHIDGKTKWWIRFKAAQVLLIAGTGYIALDALNRREFDKQTLAIGGAMIGLGIVCKLLIPNKIKLNRNVKLRIIKR